MDDLSESLTAWTGRIRRDVIWSAIVAERARITLRTRRTPQKDVLLGPAQHSSPRPVRDGQRSRIERSVSTAFLDMRREFGGPKVCRELTYFFSCWRVNKGINRHMGAKPIPNVA